MIPDVPFVEADGNIVLGALLRLHIIDDAGDGLDVTPGFLDLAEIIQRVAAVIAEIFVQRDVIDILVAFLQHLAFPFGIGRHAVIGTAADDGFNRRIEALESLGGFVRQAAIFHRGLVADLPGAVHLVAKAPHFHAVGFFRAVAAAQIAKRGAARKIHIFKEITGVIQTTGAKIDGEHHLDTGHLRPVGELVNADLVAFLGAPCEVEADGALVARPDAVFPAIGRNEVAAGITDGRNFQVLNKFQDVLAEAVRVRLRMAGLINPAIDRTPHMLDEGGIQTIVDTPNPEVPVD
ncbi:hypothetical protein D3C72_1337060 [compost metagenome]